MSAVYFRKIIPNPIKNRRVINILNGAVNAVGNDIKKDFEKTTKTWNHDVEFIKEYSVTQYGGPNVIVYTNDPIYEWVDSGTYDHNIPVGSKGFLAYQVLFSPKTSPGIIDSQPGGKFGPWTRKRWGVPHPGFQARNFSYTIWEKWGQSFYRYMEIAMQRATDATGHRF